MHVARSFRSANCLIEKSKNRKLLSNGKLQREYRRYGQQFAANSSKALANFRQSSQQCSSNDQRSALITLEVYCSSGENLQQCLETSHFQVRISKLEFGSSKPESCQSSRSFRGHTSTRRMKSSILRPGIDRRAGGK